MNLVVLGGKKQANNLYHCIIGYFIKKRIESENVIVFTDPAALDVYLDERNRCDGIFFIDVEYGNENCSGLAIAKKIRRQNKFSHIVFTAGSDKYWRVCLSSFLRPTQYLVEPISNKILYELLDGIYGDNLVDMLRITINRSHYFIRISKIVYIERQGRKTVLYSASDHLETNDTLKELYKKCGDSFIFVNQSQLVNRREISRVELNSSVLFLRNGLKFDISRNMRKQFI